MSNAKLAAFYNNPDLEDGFGSRTNRPNPHYGLDFAKGLGTPVPSLVGGRVVTSQWSAALGNVVEIKGDDGRYYGYRHLRTSAPRVGVGVRVEAGSIIGQVSDTGSAARGYHLCTTNASAEDGVFGSDACVDPWPWIQRAINPAKPSAPASNGSSPSVKLGIPRTSTQDDGITGSVFNKRLQLWARIYGGYTGPLDGVMGVESWRGVQRNLARESGYTGPIDGVPGGNTWKAVQRWATHYGYSGPIDGAPGKNTWRAVAKALNTL